MDYANVAGKNRRTVTPQSQPLPGTTQQPNSAGGFTWTVDKWKQLVRFLILGTEQGTYYIGEQQLTRENTKALEACILEDPQRVLASIAAVTDKGLAAKHEPRLFAFALLCAMTTDHEVKRQSIAFFTMLVKTGAQLFTFVQYSRGMRGNGKAFRKQLVAWYQQAPEDLAYQIVKYPERNGYTHRDLLRFARMTNASPEHAVVYRYARAMADGTLADVARELVIEARGVDASFGSTLTARKWQKLPAIMMVHALTRGAGSRTPVAHELETIGALHVPREVLPTEWLTMPIVWEVLLGGMPMTALVRNLGNLTKHGVLKPLSGWADVVCGRLRDPETIVKSKLHPLQLLAASYAYASGGGVKGSGSWVPVTVVVEALQDAFRLAFANVVPSGKRILVAVDVSGSMSGMKVNGMDYLTAAQASHVLAMVIAATEPQAQLVAFDTQVMTNYPITGRTSLQDALRCPFQGPRGTDCAAPMRWATQQRMEVDAFVLLTDNETWAGDMHPAVAVENYRRAMHLPDTRLAVVAMAANSFTIGAPDDERTMDFVGFDPSAPAALATFLRGTI